MDMSGETQLKSLKRLQPVLVTRMHCSRVRTVRCSGGHLWGRQGDRHRTHINTHRQASLSATYFSVFKETIVSACYSDVAGWKTDTHAHCTHTDTHVHAYRHTDIQTQIDISFNPKTINSLKRQKKSPKDLFWFIIFFLKIHANPSQTKFSSSQPLDPVNYRPDRHPITITIIIIIVAR